MSIGQHNHVTGGRENKAQLHLCTASYLLEQRINGERRAGPASRYPLCSYVNKLTKGIVHAGDASCREMVPDASPSEQVNIL